MSKEELISEYKRFSDLREKGKIEEAIKGYKSLIEEAEKELFVEVPEMIGVAYRMLGKPQEGLQFAKQAVNWAVKSGNKESEANARRDLGAIYKDLGEIKEAEVGYDKSLRLIWQEMAPKVSSLAGTLAFMGHMASKKGDFEKADKLIEAAVSMFYPDAILNPTEAGQYYWLMIHQAENYKRQGRKKEAKELAQEALAGFKQLKQSQTARIKKAKELITSLEIEA